MYKILLGVIGIFISINLFATNLDKYIELGLKNNLGLKQKVLLLEESRADLMEAKGKFLPSVSIETRYSRAGGGRMIEMPIGDMMNPIHNALNRLLAAHGSRAVFPANIENVVIPFLRKSEHDTKIRLVQPIFVPAISLNLKINKKLEGIKKLETKIFREDLKLNIISSYYNFLKTNEVLKILNDTKRLVEESVKISRSLFKNGKVTEEVVMRSEAELAGIEREIQNGNKNNKLANSYFNLLINRPFYENIKKDPVEYKTDQKMQSLIGYKNLSLANREEISQIKKAIGAVSDKVKLQRSNYLPTLLFVLDYGFQGTSYRFTGKDDYWMGSLMVRWNLFRGGQDKAKTRKAIYEKKRLEAQLSEIQKKILLQVEDAYYSYKVAIEDYILAKSINKRREKEFYIISKKYESGIVPQIEYIKSRNDLIAAKLKKTINLYDLFIKKAALKRAVSE